MGLILGKKKKILKTKAFSSILGTVREHLWYVHPVISNTLPLLVSCPFTRNTRKPSMCVHICLKSNHLTIFKIS